MSTQPVVSQGRNWIRYAELVVSSSGRSEPLAISSSQMTASDNTPAQLRFRFEVRAADADSPNNAYVRVYNLSQETANTIIREFDIVELSAGYHSGAYGLIFKGEVARYERGRESATDSYLDIHAFDGDLARNQSVVNTSLAAGTTDAQTLAQLAQAMKVPVQTYTNDLITTGGIVPSPRGKVMFGMARDQMRTLAKKHNARWSIQNGVLTLIPNDGYLPQPGEAIVISPQTGMIGAAASTEQGIVVRCYLNPLVQIGQLVRIASEDINQATVLRQGAYPQWRGTYFPATVSGDGLYRVMVAEHTGDTRGNDFYTELTCLTVDETAAANGKPAVQP